MISFLLKNCTDCDNLDDAICRLEGSLAEYGKNAWHNTVYMTEKSVPNVQIKRLIYYGQILNTLKINPGSYCPPYDLKTIVSRAKAVSGSTSPIVRRPKMPTYTTTTTTSTTTTSTTSTSTTTTSTSTTTTTSTSTTTSSSTTTTTTT